ncbi:hypothetical protein H113_07105 [Trichophyton rubrum MR1459]|nr:hypothetical protein H113_07105 [Trichophyton rubrum MR1459]
MANSPQPTSIFPIPFFVIDMNICLTVCSEKNNNPLACYGWMVKEYGGYSEVEEVSTTAWHYVISILFRGTYLITFFTFHVNYTNIPPFPFPMDMATCPTGPFNSLLQSPTDLTAVPADPVRNCFASRHGLVQKK